MNSNPQYGIKCPRCQDIIFSTSRHHEQFCKCGKVSVDGGTDYLRYGWANDIDPNDIIQVVRGSLYIAEGNGA